MTMILDTYVADAVKTFGTTHEAGLFMPVGRIATKLQLARRIAKQNPGSRIARLMTQDRATVGYRVFIER